MRYDIQKLYTPLNLYNEVEPIERVRKFGKMSLEEELSMYQMAMNFDYTCYDRKKGNEFFKYFVTQFSHMAQENLVAAYVVYKIKVEDIVKKNYPNLQLTPDDDFGQEIEFSHFDKCKRINGVMTCLKKDSKYKKLDVYDREMSQRHILLRSLVKTKENLSLREEAQIHDMYLAKYFTLTYDKGIALTAVRENKLSNYNLEKNNLLELKEIVAGFNRSLRVARMAQMLAEIIADRNYFLSNVQYEPVSTDTLAFKEYKKLEKEVYESKLM